MLEPWDVYFNSLCKRFLKDNLFWYREIIIFRKFFQ